MGVVVVGGQWGDEGKGRIVDALAAKSDIIARFQGGNNAGHSLHFDGQSIVLHLIPCGIVRPDKIAVIGNGVVIDPLILLEEIKELRNKGIAINPENLKISDRAHVIFSYHKSLDAKREENTSKPIGTTKRGIGPCYEDKITRFGIQMGDLLSPLIVKQKIDNIKAQRTCIIDEKKLIEEALSYGEQLKSFLCDTGEFLENNLKAKKRVLFEGAQGAMLDIDHGTYPYVTSSNCIAAQAAIGSGIGTKWLKDIFLVSKAYSTRVGEGPFFTELGDLEQEKLRKAGNEFGATTGRPRRCGWLDLVALKYACRINGATAIVITKIDILTGMGPIQVALSYRSNSDNNISFIDAMRRWQEGQKISPYYVTLPAVESLDKDIVSFKDLPYSFQALCHLIEEYCEIPIAMISYGKERGRELWLK